MEIESCPPFYLFHDPSTIRSYFFLLQAFYLPPIHLSCFFFSFSSATLCYPSTITTYFSFYKPFIFSLYIFIAFFYFQSATLCCVQMILLPLHLISSFYKPFIFPLYTFIAFFFFSICNPLLRTNELLRTSAPPRTRIN